LYTIVFVVFLICFEEDESAAIPLAEADTARVRPDILGLLEAADW
jgi:hypothetical protein